MCLEVVAQTPCPETWDPGGPEQSEAGLLLGVTLRGAVAKVVLAVSEVGCNPGGGFRQACNEIMKYHKHV